MKNCLQTYELLHLLAYLLSMLFLYIYTGQQQPSSSVIFREETAVTYSIIRQAFRLLILSDHLLLDIC